MVTQQLDETPFVRLTGVPWNVYEGFVDALEGHRLRHCYDRGMLELRREVLGVSWESYLAVLKALGDYHLRHTYNQGYLRLMSPLKSHDWVKRLISRFIESMAFDQQLPIQSVGSTTITSAKAERGFEADEAYYVASEPKVRGKMEFEPDVDPPPDLILEVDVTSSSDDQLELYAAMKVPEVWLHNGKTLRFLARNRRGKYESRENSLAFPYLTPGDIQKFLKRYAAMDETTLVRQFVAWARSRQEHWKNTQETTKIVTIKRPKGRKK